MMLGPDDLCRVREMQQHTGLTLESILIHDFRVLRFHVAQATAYLHNLPAVDLGRTRPDPAVAALSRSSERFDPQHHPFSLDRTLRAADPRRDHFIIIGPK